MNDENYAITFFDSLHPCLTAEILAEDGVGEAELSSLVRRGMLYCEEGVYFLTEAGRGEFLRAARESFIDAKPGDAPEDRARSARGAKFLRLFDAAFAQRWGIKEYYARPELPTFPELPGEEPFRAEGGKIVWPYMTSREEREMEEKFPLAGIEGRYEKMSAAAAAGAEWMRENEKSIGKFSPDIFFVCRYDYRYYEDFKGHPNDPMRLINTDRFAFIFDDGGDENLRKIGEFRRWLSLMRRAALPGFFDIDTQEQDSVSQIFFVTEEEGGAACCAEALIPFGASLTEGAEPFEIWTLSFEALAAVEEKRELVWELLPDIARPVRRMAAGRG